MIKKCPACNKGGKNWRVMPDKAKCFNPKCGYEYKKHIPINKKI